MVSNRKSNFRRRIETQATTDLQLLSFQRRPTLKRQNSSPTKLETKKKSGAAAATKLRVRDDRKAENNENSTVKKHMGAAKPKLTALKSFKLDAFNSFAATNKSQFST